MNAIRMSLAMILLTPSFVVAQLPASDGDSTIRVLAAAALNGPSALLQLQGPREFEANGDEHLLSLTISGMDKCTIKPVTGVVSCFRRFPTRADADTCYDALVLRLLKILPATVWTRVRRVPSDAVARSYSFEHADTSGTAAEIEVQRLKSLQSTSVWLMVRPY